MRFRPLLAFVAGLSVLTACDGLKEALTAHVDVVAHAASQELSVERLADLLGNAKLPIPVTKDNARVLADLWVNYTLMGHAAAQGDSLNDPEEINTAIAGITNNMRLQRFMETVSKSFNVDSSSEATYNAGAGGIYAARHILLAFPPNATPAQQDSVRKAATDLRARLTDANFASMASRFSSDSGSARQGGDLGVFPGNRMVPEFSNGTAALKPGEISQPIASTYGYHIIQRLPYSKVKAQHGEEYAQAYTQGAMQAAESTYLTAIDESADIEVKSDAAATAKAAALEMDEHRRDDATLATYNGGDLSVSEFLNWLQGFPPQTRVKEQLQQAPDSAVQGFVKAMTRNQIMLARADSAKVGLTAEEQTGIHNDFAQMVTMVWDALALDPVALADSAKTPGERESLAANHVDAFLDQLVAGQAQIIPVPTPLADLLRNKYEASINSAGLDRAVERATQVRAAADSARTATQPPSQVPLPGASPTSPPAGQAP